MDAKIDKTKCTGCGKCIDTCPIDIIKMVDGKASLVGECMACGACIGSCPQGAISF